MEKNDRRAALEALLFASGEPATLSKLSDALELGEAEVQILLQALGDELERRGSGLCVLELDGSYQLTTRREYAQPIRRLLEQRSNAPLSSAALEVLAVAAYNQPVTKAFIEQVRGVDCSGVVSTLMEKGLLEERGRLELPGRPLLYGTTQSFLRCFGLRSLEELPPLPEGDQTNLEEAVEAAESDGGGSPADA